MASAMTRGIRNKKYICDEKIPGEKLAEGSVWKDMGGESKQRIKSQAKRIIYAKPQREEKMKNATE